MKKWLHFSLGILLIVNLLLLLLTSKVKSIRDVRIKFLSAGCIRLGGDPVWFT